MRETLRASLMLASFVLLTALLVPAYFLLEGAQNQRRVPALLSKDRLDALGTRAVVLEFQKRESVRALRGSIFELSAVDLAQIVHTPFSPDDFLAKAAETHGALLNYVRYAPPDSAFVISLRLEKPLLLETARHRLHARLDGLKPCGVATKMGFVWRAFSAKLTGMSRQEFVHELPDCKPPAFVANRLHACIDQEIDKKKHAGVDRVRVFPKRDGRDHPVHRRVVLGFRSADRVLVQGAVVWLCVLLVILGTSAVIGRQPGDGHFRRLVVALACTGAVLAVEGAVVRSYLARPEAVQHILAPLARNAVESKRAWLDVAFYVIESVVADAGTRILWSGAIIGCAAAALGLLFHLPWWGRGRRSASRERQVLVSETHYHGALADR